MSRLSTKQRRHRRIRAAARIIDAYLARRPEMLHYGLMYWPEKLWPALMTDGSWPGVRGGISRWNDIGWKRLAGWTGEDTECTRCIERTQP